MKVTVETIVLTYLEDIEVLQEKYERTIAKIIVEKFPPKMILKAIEEYEKNEGG